MTITKKIFQKILYEMPITEKIFQKILYENVHHRENISAKLV